MFGEKTLSNNKKSFSQPSLRNSSEVNLPPIPEMKASPGFKTNPDPNQDRKHENEHSTRVKLGKL